MSNKIKSFLILVLLTGFAASVYSSGNKYSKEILMIDGFESDEDVNLVGGAADSWEKDTADKSEFCIAEIVNSKRGGEKNSALRLKYKVMPGKYNGYYSKLNGVDIRPYTHLEFYAKRGRGQPNLFKVELKNQFGEIGYYYVTGIGEKWQKYELPLDKFIGIKEFGRMKEFVIAFEGDVLGNTSGDIYIDDIRFTSLSEVYRQKVKEIEKDNEAKREKINKILELPEKEFLDLVSRKAFNYFLRESSSRTGFIKDRSAHYSPCSVAANGFGLAAFAIADSRKWIPHDEAVRRVRKMLASMRDKAAGHQGYFYHFIDLNTGRREWNSELSSIDTALFFGGVLLVREYFKEKDIKNICDELFSDVNWKFMMDSKSKALYMGWNPERGFEDFILWDMFGEEMLMYILGLGAPKGRLPEESWHAFRRPVKTYKGYKYIYCESESLFTYLYSHAFIDFSEKHDDYADYSRNTLNAIKANIAFCQEHEDEYRTYEEGYWGISASDGPDGYKNYGATIFTHDGTAAPYALCGSMPYTPEIALHTIRKLLEEYGPRVWEDRYGLISAFNIDRDWFSTEHIGIDAGISLLMIENYRSGFVWKYLMKNKWVQKGMERAGFEKGTRELNMSKLEEMKQSESFKQYFARRVDNASELAEADFEKFLIPDDIEYGRIRDNSDLGGRFAFLWNDKKLYMIVDVVDDSVWAREKKKTLYKGDSVELFLNPEINTLIWGNEKNFQIGFAPSSISNTPVKYAFFQDMDPEEIKVDVENTGNGYRLTAEIGWEFIGIVPETGREMGVSVAVHDVDRGKGEDKKVNWNFKNTPAGIKIGKLILK